MLDHGPQGVASLVNPVREAIPANDRRVARLYGNAGYSGLIEDALALLEVREYVVREQDAWKVGPKFKAGETLLVWPARRNKSDAVSFRAWDQLEREVISWVEGQAGAVHALAYDLRPDGPGLRPLDEQRVGYLAERIQAEGYDSRYPIWIDDETGYILSGRHRREACRRLGIEPKTITVHAEDDRDRLRIALRENDVLAWGERDLIQLARRLGVARRTLSALQERLSRKAVRESIDSQLMANPRDSDRAIARRLGVDDKTVASRRRALEENAEIPRFRATRGRGKTQREEVVEAQASTKSEQLRGKAKDRFETVERRNQAREDARVMVEEEGLGPTQAAAELEKRYGLPAGSLASGTVWSMVRDAKQAKEVEQDKEIEEEPVDSTPQELPEPHCPTCTCFAVR